MNSFKFTATACRSRTADLADTTNVILRDTEQRGLILRKQKRDWVVAFERKIRGKIWRGSLYQYDPRNFNVAAARDEVVQIMGEITAGTYQANRETRGKVATIKDMSAADIAELHHRVNPRLSDKTIRSYRYAIRYLTDDKPRLMRDVTTTYVQDAYERLLTTHSADTANQMLRSVKALWNTWAEEAEVDSKNPVAAITARKRGRVVPSRSREGALAPDRRKGWYEAAEAAAVRHGPTGTAYNALMMLFLTGYRAEEVLGLTWDDIEVDRFTTTLKGGARHTRPVTARLQAILDRQRMFHPNSPWVFPARVGDGHMGDLRKAMGNLGEKVTNHDLRRTYMGTADLAGISTVAVKLLIGHSITDITEQYIKSIRPQLPKLAVQIEDALLS
ncbi:tyrosine-type recombinase/integrase [Falsiruegeria mediterranea]